MPLVASRGEFVSDRSLTAAALFRLRGYDAI